jgi:hypothetical protein
MRPILIPCVATLSLMLAGCPKDQAKTDDSLTVAEASEALNESSASTQASELASTPIEISTNFTIGSAVEAAAQSIQAFYQSQLPCAQVTLQNATLTVTYGAKPGNCTYNGHTFSGQSTVTVKRNDNSQVEVDHTWTNLSNGLVTVSGNAQVTWNFSDKTRHVVHELNWTRLSDKRSGKGTGDRLQSVLSGGLVEGIRVDGTRTWDGAKGHWELSIQGVEMRWADPVPQAGKYVLMTPASKSLSMSFSRVDEDTIQVTVTNGSKSLRFNVSKATGEAESS